MGKLLMSARVSKESKNSSFTSLISRPSGFSCPDFSRVDIDVDVVDVLVGADVVVVQIAGHGHSERL